MSSRWSVAQPTLVPGFCLNQQYWNEEDNTKSFRCSLHDFVGSIGNSKLFDLKSTNDDSFSNKAFAFRDKSSESLTESNFLALEGLEMNEEEQIVFQFNTINIVSENDEQNYLLNPSGLLMLIAISCVLLSSLIIVLLKLNRKKRKSKFEIETERNFKNPILNEANLIRNTSDHEKLSKDFEETTPVKIIGRNLNKVFKSDELAPKKLKEVHTPLSYRKNSRFSVSSKFKNFESKNNNMKDASPFSNKLRHDIVAKLSDRFIEKLAQNSDQLSSKSTDNCSTFPISYENNKFENSFTDIVEIGTHPFGKVYKALHKLEGVYYTIKRIDINLREGDDLRSNRMFREVSAMVNLHHKNIMRLITSWVEKEPDEECELVNLIKNRTKSEFQKVDCSSSDTENKDFEIIFEDVAIDKSQSVNSCGIKKFIFWDKVSLYIQMEYCANRSLSKYSVGNDCKLSDSDIFLIFNQIVDGLIYIHSKNLIHCNLNPENIYVSSNGDIKIGEFGVATIVLNEQMIDSVKNNLKSESSCNLLKKADIFSRDLDKKGIKISNALYKASEIEKYKKYDNRVDVYSVGVILYEMLNRYRTHHEKVKQLELLKSTNKVDSKFEDRYPVQSSIIESMIASSPENRPMADTIRNLDSFVLWEMGLRVNCK